MNDTELAIAIGRAYLDSEGVSVNDEIHPRDEMLEVIGRNAARPPGSVRFDYLKAGHEARRVVDCVLAALAMEPRGLRTLELGCGFGRVTRHLAPAFDRLTVTDVHEPAVRFVESTWGVSSFVGSVEPATPAGGPHDLILALSVLNHLPAERFRDWLASLVGALSPDGVLCFSTHDASLMPGVDKSSDGYTFVPESESGHLDPREYGTAFATADVVEAAARDAGAAMVYRSPRELWFFQDLWVVGKREHAALAARRPASVVRGRVERLTIDPEGKLGASGWAADFRDGAPLAQVMLRCGPIASDGTSPRTAILGGETPGQANYMDRSDFAAAGWTCEGRWPLDASGVIWFEGVNAVGVQRFDVRHVEWAPGRTVVLD